MVLRSNLRIVVILFLFLGVNWVFINVLPREINYAHTEPTAGAAVHA